jgi:hypothetical protein
LMMWLFWTSIFLSKIGRSSFDFKKCMKTFDMSFLFITNFNKRSKAVILSFIVKSFSL